VRGARNEPQSAGPLFGTRDPRTTAHDSTEWTRRESNPGCRHAIPASYRLDHEPTFAPSVEPQGVEPCRRVCKTQLSPASDPVLFVRRSPVDPRGIAPRSPACEAGVFLLDYGPNFGASSAPSDLGGSRTHTPRGSRLSTDPDYQVPARGQRFAVAQEGLAPSRPLQAPASETGVTAIPPPGQVHTATRCGVASLGLEPSSRAYEAQSSTCPPAVCRPAVPACRASLAFAISETRGLRPLCTGTPGCAGEVADLGVEPSIQAYETRSGAGPSAMYFSGDGGI
jgi:hypothetical protein